MIKEITQYPTQTGFNFGGSVRHFDDTLYSVITDLEDSIKAHQLDGLSAFQINSPLNIIVIKDKGQFLAMMNPVIFTKEGEIISEESTAYYPSLTAKVKRAKNIKVMYDDKEGKQQFLTASDDLAILIQRKSDYLLGSSFITRLDSQEKQSFEHKLKTQSNINIENNCSLSPFSDKILSLIKYLLILGLVALLGGLFDSISVIMSLFEYYLMLGIASLIGIYFILALYEGKRCGVCQLGNTFAVAVIKSVHLGGLYLLNSWLLFT